MAKKTSDQRPIVKDDPSRIIQSSLEDVMHNSMIPYAEHVIMERAIPRVEDGLKPVQRRILYTMHELGLSPDKPHRKCARIVGDCLGKYHPHGDYSVYDALVRMAQPFSMRGPMVDGHGNFGSVDGDSAAAMRYTEARMAPLALLMLRDIEKALPWAWPPIFPPTTCGRPSTPPWRSWKTRTFPWTGSWRACPARTSPPGACC